MNVGRELDALVAEKVFGLKVEWHNGVPLWVGGEEIPGTPCDLGGGKYGHTVRRYSVDIEAAWEVVKKLRFTVASAGGADDAGYWVGFHGEDNGSIVGDVGNDSVVWAQTAPLAICNAALKKYLSDLEKYKAGRL